MAFNRKIKLFDKESGCGASPASVTNEKTLWCEPIKSYMKTKADSLSVGFKLVERVQVWKKEYCGQNSCTFDGNDYMISETSDADNNLKLILYLSRS